MNILVSALMAFSIFWTSCKENNRSEEKATDIVVPKKKYLLSTGEQYAYKVSTPITTQYFSFEYISERQIRFQFVSESKDRFCKDTIEGLADVIIPVVRKKYYGNPWSERPWRDAFIGTSGNCVVFVKTRGRGELKFNSSGCIAIENEGCPLISTGPMIPVNLQPL